MKPWARMSAVGACFALTLGCDRQTEVQRQTSELQAAQKNVGKVTQELETELAKAKADVALLEQKLARARQGLTDEVLENQRELTAALSAQNERVKAELGDAKREAEIYGRDTEAALKQLRQTTGSAAATNAAEPPMDPAQPARAEEGPEREDLVPVKGGPDPSSDNELELEPGTVAPAAPPAAMPPNDPPAPVPAPPPVTTLPPNATPRDTDSSNVAPHDTPEIDTESSDAPPRDTSGEAAPNAAPGHPPAPAPAPETPAPTPPAEPAPR
jgi:hypothetical protein